MSAIRKLVARALAFLAAALADAAEDDRPAEPARDDMTIEDGMAALRRALERDIAEHDAREAQKHG